MTPKRVRFWVVVPMQGLIFSWFTAPQMYEEHNERYNSDNRSSGMLVLSSHILGPALPRHNEGSTNTSGGPKHRPDTEIKKYARSFFHLPRSRTRKAAGEGKKVVGKPAPGTEIIDQRKEEVVARNGCVPLLRLLSDS